MWADGREAVIGLPPGGSGPAVWVEHAGRQTLKFAWSLAGVAELGERHGSNCEYRLVPTALMSLELPADQVPTAPAGDVLLTGPFPTSGDPPFAEWRFRFGGRSRLDFGVRPAANPGVPAAAALVAKYDLSPGHLTCDFTYELGPRRVRSGSGFSRSIRACVSPTSS